MTYDMYVSYICMYRGWGHPTSPKWLRYKLGILGTIRILGCPFERENRRFLVFTSLYVSVTSTLPTLYGGAPHITKKISRRSGIHIGRCGPWHQPRLFYTGNPGLLAYYFIFFFFQNARDTFLQPTRFTSRFFGQITYKIHGGWPPRAVPSPYKMYEGGPLMRSSLG